MDGLEKAVAICMSTVALSLFGCIAVTTVVGKNETTERIVACVAAGNEWKHDQDGYASCVEK